MQINRIDHLVLTVADIERTVDFYRRALGMERVEFAGGRVALQCGMQKINLHQAGREFDPKAQRPTPGSADICLIADTPVAQIIEHLLAQEVSVIEGPIERSGASGPITSVYLCDPNGNLLEVSNYIES